MCIFPAGKLIHVSGIILGNLPFVGISYHGHHHSQALAQKFASLSVVQPLIQEAIQSGIHEFAVQVIF